MKLCPHCGESKPRSEFYVRSSSPDGLQARCKDCQKGYYRESPKYRETKRKYAADRVGQNPLQAAAHAAVNKAIAAGTLVPEPCEVCGRADGIIDSHHDDYTKPLEVRWLCRKHHRAFHAALKKLAQQTSVIRTVAIEARV